MNFKYASAKLYRQPERFRARLQQVFSVIHESPTRDLVTFTLGSYSWCLALYSLISAFLMVIIMIKSSGFEARLPSSNSRCMALDCSSVFPYEKRECSPWLVWLWGLSVGLPTKGSSVRFPVRAPAWVAGQIPSRGLAKSNHTLMFLSLSFSPPFPLSKINK